jgi:hypothetical protein
MIKLIILILVICLIVSISYKENFIVNPDLHIKKFRDIHSHFRRCTQNNGIYSCIASNPYKSVIPYKRFVPRNKKIDYTKYKKSSHLLPVTFDKN